jgi:signal transduction histidine kinase
MNRRLIVIAAAAAVFALNLFNIGADAHAGQATPAEAQAMVQEAAAYFEAHGAQATVDAVNAGGEFARGELYVFMIDPDGISVANAGDRSRLGQDTRLMQDSDGKFYGQEMLERATAEGVWVNYKRLNPASGQTEPKTSWVRRIQGYVVGCGIYKSE